MARTAFVTGATGFLGLNLVEALAREGWHVHALHRRGSNLRHLSRLPAERVEGDVGVKPKPRKKVKVEAE